MADNPQPHNHDHDAALDHAHTHASRHAEPMVNVVDPAQQSLSDALRVSFWLLRFVMIALVVVYLFSGVYQVAEQEEAVVTRFGKIVTDSQGVQTVDRGFHWGWPFPIDNVVTVPTNERTIDIANAFVYEGEGENAGMRPLNPERDGSLITGDANIVHARFKAAYVISDPVAFIKNFGDPDGITQDSIYARTDVGTTRVEANRTGLQIADALVTNMVEQGIVHAVAADTADDIIAGRFSADRAVGVAQRNLDQLDVGITLTNIAMRLPEMPQSVRDAYGLVAQSEATKSTRINEAESDRTRLLGEAAGKAALPIRGEDGPLVNLIKEYELATTLDDTERLAGLDQQLSRAFRELNVETSEETPGAGGIGGETATIINNAQIAKSQIASRLKTEAQTVLELRTAFEQDPELFKQRRWQYVLRDIFAQEDSGIELFYTASGQRMLIEMNRDPDIARTKERQRLESDMAENAAE